MISIPDDIPNYKLPSLEITFSQWGVQESPEDWPRGFPLASLGQRHRHPWEDVQGHCTGSTCSRASSTASTNIPDVNHFVSFLSTVCRNFSMLCTAGLMFFRWVWHQLRCITIINVPLAISLESKAIHQRPKPWGTTQQGAHKMLDLSTGWLAS